MRLDWAVAAAAFWGFAEATFFFIVPDVLLMFLAAPRFKRAYSASLAALAGALLGGSLMYLYGFLQPERARDFLDGVPGIQSNLIVDVGERITRDGAAAVLLGPARGTPYKIYAVEWGAQHLPVWSLLLISIPARYGRFILSPLFALAVYRLAGRFAPRLLALGWLIFYGFYFSKFGL